MAINPRPHIIIIGMGPAGLAAAARLKGTGIRFTIVDSGKAVQDRDRYLPEDATRGHGGVGLFSDGKFSFFPSASELWSLPREVDLREAYDWTCDVLNHAGLETPPFPSNPDAYSVAGLVEIEQWKLKKYPSDYLSLDARLRLVRDMVGNIDGAIMNEGNVKSATYHPDTDSFTVVFEDRTTRQTTCLTVNRLLVATGRFGPLEPSLRSMTQHHHFRRLEVGFCIQQRSERAFFRSMPQLDPKLRVRESDGSVEWRTFCVCRQGETCLTETNGLWTVSGWSDCPAPTGRSNSGFNTRVLDEDLARRSLDHVVKAMGGREAQFELPAQGLLRGDAEVVAALEVYGPALVDKMAEGLRRLAQTYDDLGNDDEATLIGPTLEGVGWYPKVDGNLRLLDAPVWVAGDACGLFRGIVAAMISGHYAAASAIDELVQGARAQLAALAEQTSVEIAMPSSKWCVNRLLAAIACDGPCCSLAGM